MKTKYLWTLVGFTYCLTPAADEQGEVNAETPVLFHFGNPENESYSLPEEKAFINSAALDEVLSIVWTVIENDRYGIRAYDRHVTSESGDLENADDYMVSISFEYNEYLNLPASIILFDLALTDLKISAINYMDYAVARDISFWLIDLVSIDKRGLTLRMIYAEEEGYTFIIDNGDRQYTVEGTEVLTYKKCQRQY
jgi:hypothetical protein